MLLTFYMVLALNPFLEWTQLNLTYTAETAQQIFLYHFFGSKNYGKHFQHPLWSQLVYNI